MAAVGLILLAVFGAPPWTLGTWAARDNGLAIRAAARLGADPSAVDPSVRMSPLSSAANVGSLHAAEALLQAGANVDPQQGDLGGPLHNAAGRGDVRMVELLLDYGADPRAVDTARQPPLSPAVRAGHREVAELLLARGADPNAHPAGLTPLMECRSADMARLLLRHGADARAANGWGSTALHERAADTPVLQVLLAAGADPNARTVDGTTPLHAAASEGSPASVRALLAAGADPRLREVDGRTAADLAEGAGDHDLAALLRDAEAGDRGLASEILAFVRSQPGGSRSQCAEALLGLDGLPPDARDAAVAMLDDTCGLVSGLAAIALLRSGEPTAPDHACAVLEVRGEELRLAAATAGVCVDAPWPYTLDTCVGYCEANYRACAHEHPAWRDRPAHEAMCVRPYQACRRLCDNGPTQDAVGEHYPQWGDLWVGEDYDLGMPWE